MIILAELVLTIQLVVLTYGIMLLGKAFKEKNLTNKIAGFILVIGTAIFFACTMCHMVKFHKHHKYGFHGYKGKHQCQYAKDRESAEKLESESEDNDDD